MRTSCRPRATPYSQRSDSFWPAAQRAGVLQDSVEVAVRRDLAELLGSHDDLLARARAVELPKLDDVHVSSFREVLHLLGQDVESQRTLDAISLADDELDEVGLVALHAREIGRHAIQPGHW